MTRRTKQRGARRDAMKDGTMPRRGMYIRNTSTGRAFGPILCVTHEGVIVWSGTCGARVHTDPETIHHGPYLYEASP